MNENQKRKLLIGVIAATSLPAILLVTPPSSTNLQSLALYGSAITGYLGVMLLLWMYVIGARSVFSMWFKDLAPILSIHKWLGKYGSIAILLHPLLIVYSYGESLLYTVVPQLGTTFERHVTLGRLSFLLVLLVWVTSALLRKRLGYRPWKYIHYLTYISLPFALLHIPDVGSQYMSSVALKAYYLFIVVALFVFSLLRLRGWLASNRSSYVVIRHDKLSDGTYLLELGNNDGNPLAPRPGQFVYIRSGIVSEDHPFSVVDYDPATNIITLAYRVFGRFTDYLQTVPRGAEITLAGPYGEFTSDISDSDKTVFIAGGIGITPFVEHILNNDGNEQWLFYANRTPDSATFAKPLSERLGDRYIPVYSQDETTMPSRIDSHLITSSLTDPSQYTYYLCGPEGMVSATFDSLLSIGVNKNRIHRESFEF